MVVVAGLLVMNVVWLSAMGETEPMAAVVEEMGSSVEEWTVVEEGHH